MRLWVMSDLHTEFAPFRVPEKLPDADVCVVAGDFGIRGVDRALLWLHRHVAHAIPVVFVAGNHDFYRTSLVESVQEGRELASRPPGVHFLENETVELDGVTFVGCTLWTDFALHGRHEVAMFDAKAAMTDYRKIKFSKVPFARFTPSRSARLHVDSRSFLQKALSQADGPTVVVTHHAPSRLSLPGHLRDDAHSPAYASDLEHLMLEHGPRMWVHGHVHESVDYTLGRTRVVAAPRGYPGERHHYGDYAGVIIDL